MSRGRPRPPCAPGLHRIGAGLVLAGFLTGCSPGTDITLRERSSGTIVGEVLEDQASLANSLTAWPATSLPPDTPVKRLAGALDAFAISRSSAELRQNAAAARVRARKRERLPRFRPSASAPLSGDGDPSARFALEQMIWDGGRLRARLDEAELAGAEAELRALLARSDDVLSGLEAYLEISRRTARLQTLDVLEQDLDELGDLIRIRSDGGVADGGERLRLQVAQRQVSRDRVAGEAALRRARAELDRLLPEGTGVTAIGDIEAAATMCRRQWPETDAPADVIAHIEALRAAASEAEVKARRFPRVVASAGQSFSTDGSSDPGLGLELDSSDLLGFGRGDALRAAALERRAAEAAYLRQQQDTRAELERFAEDHAGYRSDIAELRRLDAANRETLALYRTQLDAGAVPIAEGIDLLRESTDTKLALVDLHTEVVINCLQSAELRGVLIPYEVANG